jgi:hypothetical protein
MSLWLLCDYYEITMRFTTLTYPFAIVRVILITPIPRRIFIDFFSKYSVGILGKLGILGISHLPYIP